MVLGTGVDILDIERVAKVYKKFAEKFSLRILSQYEKEKFENLTSESLKVHFLAKRFAAKEAVLKAIGIGFRDISWHAISITNDDKGKPSVMISQVLQNILLKKFANTGLVVHISLSDEKKYCIAFAVLETV